jgi:hypothetical protein
MVTMKNVVFWDIETPVHTLQEKHYISDAESSRLIYVRFDVFKAVTMKNAVSWDVMSCGSCRNRLFDRTSVLTNPHDAASKKATF